jgi:hypothetical protein
MYVGVNDVRQAEIHTADPIVPEPSVPEIRWLLKSIVTNHQILIKYQQN